MKPVIFIVISFACYSQVRKPAQYTIFYKEVNTDSSGIILVWPDSLKAFEITWKILDADIKDSYSDWFQKGVILLEYKNQRAALLVNYREINFYVFNVMDYQLIQFPHEKRLYEKYR